MNKYSRFEVLAVTAVVGALFAVTGHAGPKPKSKTLNQDEEEKLVLVTGSHIPQRVKKKSIGTNSAHNVRIFTKDELQSTGRFGVRGLGLDPSVQFSGR